MTLRDRGGNAQRRPHAGEEVGDRDSDADSALALELERVGDRHQVAQAALVHSFDVGVEPPAVNVLQPQPV